MTELYIENNIKRPLYKRIIAGAAALFMGLSFLTDLPISAYAEEFDHSSENNVDVSEEYEANEGSVTNDDSLMEETADDLSDEENGLPVFDDERMTAASVTGGGEEEALANYEMLLSKVSRTLSAAAPVSSDGLFAYDNYEQMVDSALEKFSFTYDTTFHNEDGDTAEHIERSENFFVKGVIEVHSQLTVNPGKMSFKIPKYLLTERNGYKCAVSSVGVSPFKDGEVTFAPFKNSDGTYDVEDYKNENDPTPFRYYDDGENLVFVNIRELHSETIRIQVSYENVEVFDVVDNTDWELEPYIDITYDIPKTGFLDGVDDYTECTYNETETTTLTVYEHSVEKISGRDLIVYKDNAFRPLYVVDATNSSSKKWYKVEDSNISDVTDFRSLTTEMLWTKISKTELQEAPKISENIESLKVENEKGSGITGKVNTSVKLNGVNKLPETDNNGYGSQLYTLGQMKRYMDTSKLDSAYLKNGNLNTDEYIFTTWRVNVNGTCTQPWSMLFEENPWIDTDGNEKYNDGDDVKGTVLGVSTWKGIPDINKKNFNADVQYKESNTTEIQQLNEFLTKGGTAVNQMETLTNVNTGELWYVADANKFDSDNPDQYDNIRTKYGLITSYKNVVKDRRFNSEYSIVVAYPKTQAINNALSTPNTTVCYPLCNQVTVHLFSRDGTIEKFSEAAQQQPITYKEYKWTGGGTYFDSGKSSGKDKEGWLTIYNHKDSSTVPYMGNLDFTEWMSFKGYDLTHETSGSYGYKQGSYVRIVNADDVITAQAYGEVIEGGAVKKVYGKPYVLGEGDYYFSNAEIGVIELDIDPFADETQAPDPDVKIKEDDSISRDWVVYGWYGNAWHRLNLTSYGFAHNTITIQDYLDAKKDSGGYANFKLNFENDTDKPCRLKVEKNSIGYQTKIRIKPNVVIRTSSDKFKMDDSTNTKNKLYSEFYYENGTQVSDVSTVMSNENGALKVLIRNYSANTVTSVNEDGQRNPVLNIGTVTSVNEDGTQINPVLNIGDETKYYDYESNVYDSSINGNRYDFVDQSGIYRNDKRHTSKDDLQPGDLTALGKALLESRNLDLDGNSEYVSNKYIAPDGDVDYSLYGGNYDYDKNSHILRDSAALNVTALIPNAQASKYAAYENDTRRGRVIMTYTLFGYEGYMLDRTYEQDIINSNTQEPLRRTIIIKDLLPAGVNVYSTEPTVGKLKKALIKETGTVTYPDVEKYVSEQWDTNKAELIGMDTYSNWENTGRTLVTFKIQYKDTTDENGDIGFFANDRWFIGCGIRFQAYVSWDDYEAAKIKDNIFAYVASSEGLSGITYNNNLLGKYTGNARTTQTYDDNGTLIPTSDSKVDYTPFSGMTDFDSDNITNEYNRMYGHANSMDSITTARTLGITKSVKADHDVSAEYVNQTGVIENETYTYKIHIDQSGHGNTGDIVVFDNLEARSESVNETKWYGTIKSVNIEEIENNFSAQQPDPVIWYSESREAPTKLYEYQNPDYNPDTDPDSAKYIKTLDYETYHEMDSFKNAVWDFDKVNTLIGTEVDSDGKSKKWIKADNWSALTDEQLSEIRSIAVDLSKTKNNNEKFIVTGTNVLNLYIQMTAPAYQDGYTYTFNGSSFCFSDYAMDENKKYVRQSNTEYYSYSNTTAVTLGQKRKLEVIKDVPADHMTQEYLENAVFTFKVTNRLTYITSSETNEEGNTTINIGEKDFNYANIEYELWEKPTFDGNYSKVSGAKHYTNEDGEFNLTYLQKAVFTEVSGGPDVSNYDFDNFMIVEKSAPYVFGTKTVIKLDENNAVTNVANAVKTVKLTVTNHYRPVIYLTKNVTGVPDNVSFSDEHFTFFVKVKKNNYDPITGEFISADYLTYYDLKNNYIVLNNTINILQRDKSDGSDSKDSRLDGRLYAYKVSEAKGLYDLPQDWNSYPNANVSSNAIATLFGTGGMFKFKNNIQPNTTYAIPIYIQHFDSNNNDEGMLIEIGGKYYPRYEFEISEEIDENNNSGNGEWKLQSPADNNYSTDLENEQNSAVFTNIYKYKELLLKKTVTHAPANLGDYAFAFRLTDKTGNAYKSYGNNKSVSWTLCTQDSNGKLTEYKTEFNGNDCNYTGTVNEDGVFVVPFCGNSNTSANDPFVIRISGAEMENTYTITEILSQEDINTYIDSKVFKYDRYYLNQYGKLTKDNAGNTMIDNSSIATHSDFRAVIGRSSADLTKKDLSADLAIENDYLKRDIKISKIVAASTMPDSGKTFEMMLATKSTSAPVTAKVTVTKADGTTDTAQTAREDGTGDFAGKYIYTFSLHNNDSIVFEDIDKAGAKYELYEEIDDDYKPITLNYTEGKTWSDPHNITLSQSEDYAYTVVNGEEGYVIIRKEYTGDKPNDETILSSKKVKISITLPVAKNLPTVENNLALLKKGNGDIQVLDRLQDIELTSNDILIINAKGLFGDSYSDMKITETDWEKNFETTNKIQYVIKPASTGQNGYGEFVFSKDEPQAVIVNEVTEFKSVIYKRIGGSLENVKNVTAPTGDISFVLTKNGSPVQGVKCVPAYIDGNGNTVMSDTMVTSGADGKITLNLKMLSGDKGWSQSDGAAKYFLKLFFSQNVKIGGGDISISEDRYGTSADWGALVGYENYGDKDTYVEKDTTLTNKTQWSTGSGRDTFVNTQDTEKAAVTKTIHHETAANYTDDELDAEFTFTVSQKIGSDYLSAPHIKYTVYELNDKNNETSGYKTDFRTGETGSDGTFTLKHGEKAELELYKNCEWQIVENNAGKYKLRVDENDNITHGGNVGDGGNVSAATSYNEAAAADPYNTKEIAQGFELGTTNEMVTLYPYGYDVVFVNGSSKGTSASSGYGQPIFAKYVDSEDYYISSGSTTKYQDRYYSTDLYKNASTGLAYRQKYKYLLGNQDSSIDEIKNATTIYLDKDCTDEYWTLEKGYQNILSIPDVVYTKASDTELSVAHKVVGIGKAAMQGSNSPNASSIPQYTFVIPKYVEIIGDNVFNEKNGSSNSLKDIIWNCTNLKSIGQWSFRKSLLEKVAIPETVEEIKKEAFDGCTKMSCMILPSGKLTLGENSINFNIQKSITIFKTTKVSDLTIDKAPATNHSNWYYVFPYLTKSEVESAEWYSKIS